MVISNASSNTVTLPCELNCTCQSRETALVLLIRTTEIVFFTVP